ncbi:MAG: CsgG/HfaB family protein [Candidatus Cloacimonetes bacterium]|nr:CsgG/HfaB family protein [Candidatus Cloacimonadota bacterium]
MELFKEIFINKSYSYSKTMFLMLLASLLLFNISCVSNPAHVDPISNRQNDTTTAGMPSPQNTNQQNDTTTAGTPSPQSRQNNVDITEALQRAIDDAFLRVPTDAVVAVLHVAAPTQAVYEYLFGEIEHILVRNKGYNVSDRSQLDQIRIERDFQLSWEVDDTTAASIGRFVGADAVITGRIDGDGSLQRLRIRVLNTETALVMGTGSEPFASWIDSSSNTQQTPSTTNVTVSVGDIIVVGRFQWIVLEISGNRALIITQDIIDSRPYNLRNENITWANSSLRAYLNGDFFNTFNATDRARIVLTDVQNPNNPTYGTGGGVATRDRVFLLSIDEARRYFNSNSERVALLNGQPSLWWLRSPGRYSNSASRVNINGDFRMDGSGGTGGIRPALWLNL